MMMMVRLDVDAGDTGQSEYNVLGGAGLDVEHHILLGGDGNCLAGDVGERQVSGTYGVDSGVGWHLDCYAITSDIVIVVNSHVEVHSGGGLVNGDFVSSVSDGLSAD